MLRPAAPLADKDAAVGIDQHDPDARPIGEGFVFHGESEW
jgi:hypothetical protein